MQIGLPLEDVVAANVAKCKSMHDAHQLTSDEHNPRVLYPDILRLNQFTNNSIKAKFDMMR